MQNIGHLVVRNSVHISDIFICHSVNITKAKREIQDSSIYTNLKHLCVNIE